MADPYPDPIERLKVAEQVWDWKADEKRSHAWIAETLGCSKSTVSKLIAFYKKEVVIADRAAELELILAQLDADIADAQGDVDALATDPIERTKARELLWKLQDRRIRLLGIEPPRKNNITVKTGPAMPEPPDDPELDNIYNNWKAKHS